MPLHRAVGCDTTGCLALYLAAPQLGRDAAQFAAVRAGWSVTAGGLTSRCPCCARGGLPVLERGDCPVCTGTTFSREDAEVCHHCGHTTAHPADAYDDEDKEPGEPLHAAEADR
ncbi:hypothetical protein GCM10010310_79130 [Streptomyces violaceolatus]|uniref:C2H2-type domain-containing protein n=1 Tax=Streptomyces violaceolatus TaxID=67378 RepID=A0ABN3THQ9_9ACTN